MKRRASGETVSRLRLGRTPELSEAARKAARWVSDNIGAIRECDPDIPDAIYNRAADNWSPLLAIAEVIGGAVVGHARQPHFPLVASKRNKVSVQCCVAIFARRSPRMAAAMPSADLVAALVADG